MNGVPTHVLSLRSHSEHESLQGKRNPLVLIIPGSPGMGHFYVPFASKLFDLGQGGYDVSVISHAGHSPGHYKGALEQDSDDKTQDEASVDWYTLQDQIAHKLSFIKRESAGRASLILIGHSIGCWMILQMLRESIPVPVTKIFLLFPTIEKLAMTPNAHSYASYLWSSMRKPFTGLIWMASKVIPDYLKRFILTRHFYTTPAEHMENITQAVINIDDKSIYNVLLMAQQEMEVVVDPPVGVIQRNIDKIVLYYGVGDGWNVESCYSDMAARFPGKEVHLCDQNYPHAFIECASNEMAEYVYLKLST